MSSMKQRRGQRKDTKPSSKGFNPRALRASKTPASSIFGQCIVCLVSTCSSLQDLLRRRTVWFALIILAAIASAVYYDLMSNFNLSVFHEADVRRPAFEVVDLPGKGKGVVALRDIRVCISVMYMLLAVFITLFRSKENC
jgi:hypothetical protein